jgi:hypothetical protein
MTGQPDNRGRGGADARAEELIRYGTELFNAEGLYAPVTKLRKIAQANLRTSGYLRAKAEIVALFAKRAGYEIESYEKAFKTSTIKNIALVGKKSAPLAVAAARGENQTPTITKEN